MFLSIAVTWSSTAFNLNSVNVECTASASCMQRTARLKTLVGEYRSLTHLKDTLKVLASDGGYKSFYYQIEESGEGHNLLIRFLLKPVISEISVRLDEEKMDYDINQLIALREGDFFEIQKLKESTDNLKEKLETYGYPNNSHRVEVVEQDSKVKIVFSIALGKPRIFKTILSNSKSQYVKNYLKRKFLSFYKRPFDINRFKIYLDDAQKELFSYGYYLINLDFTGEGLPDC
jgi:outer membrane protein assembly factor BamA